MKVLSFLVPDCKVVLLKVEQHPLQALWGTCQWFCEDRLKGFVVRFNVDFLATVDIGVKTFTGKHNRQKLLLDERILFPRVLVHVQHTRLADPSVKVQHPGLSEMRRTVM